VVEPPRFGEHGRHESAHPAGQRGGGGRGCEEGFGQSVEEAAGEGVEFGYVEGEEG